MGKIITITANTAIDNIIEVHNFAVGHDFRTERSRFFPSGKGINAARTIEALGQQVLALGWVGASSRSLYERLNTPLFRVDLSDVQGETRTNLTILDPIANTQTHIQNRGFHVGPDDFVQLEARLGATIAAGDIVVMSGSLPPGTDSTAYERLIKRCHDAQARTILDTSSTFLESGIRAHPYMIKPNIKEFEALIGYRVHDSDAAIVEAANAIVCQGVSLVIVSCGRQGIIAVAHNSRTAWKAYIRDVEPVITTGVGSGDALVGGFAVALLEKRPIVDAIRLGVACGTANLFTLTPGLCDRADIERFVSRVEIEELPLTTG